MLRRKSKPEKRRRGELFLDRNGIAFDKYHYWLPPRVADWPTPPIVKDDRANAMGTFHEEWSYCECWWCHRRLGLKMELHHLAGGSRGRSHERCLFCWTCSECHSEHAGLSDMGRWLWAKWYYDREWVDWVRTALRLRRFLPDLIGDDDGP